MTEQAQPIESIDISDEIEDKQDPHRAKMLQTFADVQLKIDEENAIADHYFINHAEFVAALDYIVADQLSVLDGDQLSTTEWARRFNRWFVFCDAVVNLGIACVYSKQLIEQGDYETVFKGIKVNAIFNTTFLKPRGIEVIFTHKSPEVKEKYPWLAMPCLIIKDKEGVEHQIAITTSPRASVWWLDILAGFHQSYNWNLDSNEIPLGDEDNPYLTLGDHSHDGDVDDTDVDENGIPTENK